MTTCKTFSWLEQSIMKYLKHATSIFASSEHFFFRESFNAIRGEHNPDLSANPNPFACYSWLSKSLKYCPLRGISSNRTSTVLVQALLSFPVARPSLYFLSAARAGKDEKENRFNTRVQRALRPGPWRLGRQGLGNKWHLGEADFA